MSKSAFAELCNVAPSRVSHWIRDRRLTGDALVGEGRGARINVAVAQAQLRGNLDPHQMMATGNGAATRLNAQPEPEGEPLSDDAAALMAVVREMPSLAAWGVAQPGGSLQPCFDIFANLRLDALAGMRARGFTVEESDIEAVDWRGLAEEIGLSYMDPKRMAADWQRRRDAE